MQKISKEINYMGKLHTGILVKRATKALEVKHRTETTVKPATCQQQNTSVH